MGLSKLVYELTFSLIENAGFGVLFVETIPSKTQVIVRLFIEHNARGKESQPKISLSDCEKVSKLIENILDTENIFLQEIGQKSYVLEVSSPGIQPPICHVKHFIRYSGEIAHIKLKTPFESKRNLTGEILRTENENLVLKIDEQEKLIPLSSIHKANVLLDDNKISRMS